MKALPLKDWPDFLLDWAEPNRTIMAQSPQRRELSIFGELPAADGKLSQFFVGRARDEFGTVVHLKPAQDPPVLGLGLLQDATRKTKEEEILRQWNRWWAKIAVRSGYLSPAVDPVAFARLNELRQCDSRVDFIVDTNVVIGGVGHWLVRCFGDLCDLVRTVVTDLEIQRFGDNAKWSPSKIAELDTRANYLAASRFLEYLQAQHPVWRRLDIEEETALFVASASRGGGKEPGADTLLLRAVRRSLQDQVPGLVRLFVTSDQKLARAASHDLPPGSTIAAYVNPISEQGTYLCSVHWWPQKGRDCGAAFVSSLADFTYEATCLCDAVRLVKADGSFLRVSSYLAGRNQFPVDWREPNVWVEVGNQGPIAPQVVGPVAESAVQSQPESSSGRIVIAPKTPTTESRAWPFDLESPLVSSPKRCIARVSAPTLLDVLSAIMLASRESLSISERVFPESPSTARELKFFLRVVDALDGTSHPGPSAVALQAMFANDDTDSLSRLLTKASEYHELISELSSRRSSTIDKLNIPKRSAGALAGLARLLGQAVLDGGELVYGGAYVSRDDFVQWFMGTVQADPKGPLGGTLLADISRKALLELSVSPTRLEKALRAAMEGSPLAELEFLAGGTPEHVLEEEVAVLNSKGWTRRKVSADGLLGYRSVRRR